MGTTINARKKGLDDMPAEIVHEIVRWIIQPTLNLVLSNNVTSGIRQYRSIHFDLVAFKTLLKLNVRFNAAASRIFSRFQMPPGLHYTQSISPYLSKLLATDKHSGWRKNVRDLGMDIESVCLLEGRYGFWRVLADFSGLIGIAVTVDMPGGVIPAIEVPVGLNTQAARI